jgi:hypothetical protein
MDISASHPPHTARESVLPNVSIKWIQLPCRICSTSTAAAGAATVTAGALPNAP